MTRHRVLICGSRDWTDGRMILDQLADLTTVYHVTVVAGGARGADRLAAMAARQLDLPVEEYFADWDKLGKQAGFRRNEQMLASGVDEVWAFKDGFAGTPGKGGTEHMVRIARQAGVPVELFTHDP